MKSQFEKNAIIAPTTMHVRALNFSALKVNEGQETPVSLNKNSNNKYLTKKVATLQLIFVSAMVLKVSSNTRMEILFKKCEC